MLIADMPVSAVSQDCSHYATAQQAALAALGQAVDYSQSVEQAGGIVQLPDGSYTYTNPVSNKDAEHFAVRLRFNGKLVGIYHTHPGNGADADRFSADDKSVAESLRVDSYLRVVASNSVYKLKVNGNVMQIAGPQSCHHGHCAVTYAAQAEAARRILQ